LPFHPLEGIQTSIAISESEDGLIIAVTRHLAAACSGGGWLLCVEPGITKGPAGTDSAVVMVVSGRDNDFKRSQSPVCAVAFAAITIRRATNFMGMIMNDNCASMRRVTNHNLFVISGGPGSGKTTVVRELKKFGFRYAPEVARQIIQEQVRLGGTALPWKDGEAYTYAMLQRSIDSFVEHTPAVQPMFSDRGIPDTLCYARLIGLRDVRAIEEACRQYRYASVVLLAPPWREMYETDSERKQDFDEAERTFVQMKDVYRDCDYEVLELPKASPAYRAGFIVERLGLTGVV
jgi:predicted ATPase